MLRKENWLGNLASAFGLAMASMSLLHAGTSYGNEVDDPSAKNALSGCEVPAEADSLLADFGFESSVSSFFTTHNGAAVQRSTVNPIQGTGSLRVSLTQPNKNVWWVRRLVNTDLERARKISLAALIRGDQTNSNATVSICLGAIYHGSAVLHQSCYTASNHAGQISLAHIQLDLDPTKIIETVGLRISKQGGGAVVYSIDNVVLALDALSPCEQPSPTPSPIPSASPAPDPSPLPSPSPTAPPSPLPIPSSSPLAVTAVWANSGEDKVTQDELRVSNPDLRKASLAVKNNVWDGSFVNLTSAANETVGFNVIIEAQNGAKKVAVALDTLYGPGGYQISGTPAQGDGVFNYIGRNIELFFIRYLQIKGLSRLSYDTYDERQIPIRFQRPSDSNGVGTGSWTDRPDHDKYYPDIAVPLEWKGQFDIAAAKNQSVWVDIYVPSDAPAGTYYGLVKITECDLPSYFLPVKLEVYGFALPDAPNSKTMIELGYPDIAKRYTGVSWPNTGSSEETLTRKIRDRHFQMAHRHKLSMIDENYGTSALAVRATIRVRGGSREIFRSGEDQPASEWVPRLSGSLFTAAQGYAGVGTGIGNNVYSIGTYGSWGWKDEGETGMRTHTDAWESYFQANFPDTQRFLYLIDESTDYAQVQEWASWINNNPGPGGNLPSFATANLVDAYQQEPALDIPCSWIAVADDNSWEQTSAQYVNTPGKAQFMYNGKRPANGSFATEDDGIALRELSWGQYKKKIGRWFFWESTYYNNYQGGTGETNVFQTAQTFGGATTYDNIMGYTGWNASNGDGVLFYPGTDTVYPAESYGRQGPIASLRLKHWRRGVQDVDYLALAAAIDPDAVDEIVERMVPLALWEYGVDDQNDPTYKRTDISWSTDPDVWDSARKELADIIQGKKRKASKKRKNSRHSLKTNRLM